MKGRIFACLFLCSLFLVVGGDARSRDAMGKPDKPVWALEFVQVNPEKFGMAMGYLDDNWMRVRAEAKKEGAVLDYHRITNAALVTPGHKLTDLKSVVLLTEYKSMDDFLGSERLFDSIRQRLLKSTPGYFNLPGGPRPEDLYETSGTQVFVEEPDTSARLKFLAQK